MSARHNLRSHSPLKTVLNRLGDTYQAYCDTYKTHTMATCHGGSGQPLDRDATTTGKDIDVDILHSFHHEDTDDFENVEQENHSSLAAITLNWMIYATESKLEKDNLQKPYII